MVTAEAMTVRAVCLGSCTAMLENTVNTYHGFRPSHLVLAELHLSQACCTLFFCRWTWTADVELADGLSPKRIISGERN